MMASSICPFLSSSSTISLQHHRYPIPLICSSRRTRHTHPSRTSSPPSHPGLQTSGSCQFFGDGRDLILGQRSLAFQCRPSHRGRLAVNALFGLGVPELVVIAGVAALVFGPKKLPEIGRSLGKTVKSFQQAAKEFETEVKKGGSVTEEATKSEVAAVDFEKDNPKV